ncbi:MULTISPECIES: ImmA/IrrE family metallo-endopeptidase [unclassified Rhizobium]|uniref:ImmA/IrrE family metallo-endopeptidase n=1 Tax=unclassified Rhizobium TaxID=2613769 RepID=UPI001C8325AE|nr:MULTISPECIES: ImmA/IrrE family metallo-endopeptidase [unclassified Rhizobium]MBX5167027.1 ImmA/IrrE family metallo-endopeptidase [Rhizobium sp. NZLR4b]MBX5211174.1 ImmA/IrrE family metallo-endopeptidase [Rhizobium sp. NZLR11]
MTTELLDPRLEAQKVLDGMGLKTGPIPVERIAKSLGAQLRFSPLDDELSGMIYIKDGVPIIGVNALHHPNRQRFTIGHEIGHLLMHRSLLSNVVHVDKQFPILMRDQLSSAGSDSIEVQANKFAAALLMPAGVLREELASMSFDIDDSAPLEALAKKFKVSRQAVEFRIRSLNFS